MSRLKRLASSLLMYVPIFLSCSGFLDTTASLNQKGNKNYEDKKYETALDSYRKAQIRNPDNSTVRYNLGTTLYQLDQFQEAETQLKQALEKTDNKELQATAWYNYGNTQYRLGKFEEAINAYKKALALNPKDKDAKYNLELLQKKKSAFDIKQNRRDQEKQNRKNESPQQQKQEQQQPSGGQDQKNQQGQAGNEKSQGQQPKDQEEQGQGQHQQEQKDRQQDQKEKAQKDESKSEQEQQQEQQDEQSQEQQDQQQEEQDQEQGNKEQDRPEGEPKDAQPVTPVELKPDQQEGQKPEQQAGQSGPLLQGQMSKENALRILNALKESEQELQFLRRPQQQKESEPLKDWWGKHVLRENWFGIESSNEGKERD